MIAAAMTTRNTPAPTYADLARSGAVIRRDVAPDVCRRLSTYVEALEAVSTELRFSFDQRGRICVAGFASAQVKIPCQTCTEPVKRELHAVVEGILASSESEAVSWRRDDALASIIVVAGAELDEVELVEDELLLCIPAQVCIDAACEQRPLMAYGQAAEALAPSDTHKPFAVLEALRQGIDPRDESAPE